MKLAGIAVSALAILGCGIGALPAAANSAPVNSTTRVFTLTDTGAGGCVVSGSTWGVNGAYSSILIEDKVQWYSKNHLATIRSWATGNLYGCLNGYTYTGGTKKITVDWRIVGRTITSCNVGFGGCNIQDSYATDHYESPVMANTNGVQSAKVGGGDTYATGQAGGAIDSYAHQAKSQFSIGGETSIAQATNYFYRAFG